MKILVVSDTHGHEKNLMTVLNRVRPVDALIHCGDVEGGEDYIRAAAECPCIWYGEITIIFPIFPGRKRLCWEATGFL